MNPEDWLAILIVLLCVERLRLSSCKEGVGSVRLHQQRSAVAPCQELSKFTHTHAATRHALVHASE